MGSSNIVVFNPTFSNQETDAQYAADSLRAGGVQTDDILPSPLLNKVWCNTSSPIAALCQALANKGFVISDANYTALIAVMANVLTTVDIKSPGQNVTYTSSLVFNCAAYNGFYCALTGNVSAILVENAATFQVITISFYQGGSGGFTIAWPSNVVSPGTPSTTPGKISTQQFWLLPDGNFHPVGPMTVS